MKLSGWCTCRVGICGWLMLFGLATASWPHPVQTARLNTNIPEKVRQAEDQVARYPRDFAAALELAWWYRVAGRLDEAQHECQRADKLPGADHAMVQFDLAEILLARGEPEKALTAMWEAAESATDSCTAGHLWHRLGYVESYYKRLRQAREAYGHSLMGFGLGMPSPLVAERMGDLADVAPARDKRLWFTLAAIVSSDDSLSQSDRLALLRTLEPQFTHRAVLHVAYAVEYQRAGDTANTIAAAKRALEIQPENPGALYILANMLRKSGQQDQAIRYYRELARITQRFRDVAGTALLNLSRLYEERGEHVEAFHAYAGALAEHYISGDQWRLPRFVSLAIKARLPREALRFLEDHEAELPLRDVGENRPAQRDPWEIAGARATLFAFMGDHASMRKSLEEPLLRPEVRGQSPLMASIFHELLPVPPQAAAQWLIGYFASRPWHSSDARQRFQKAAQIAPEFALAYLWLAFAYADEDPARALSFATKALNLASADSDVRREASQLVSRLEQRRHTSTHE